MRTYVSIFFIISLIFGSCGEKKKDAKDELYDKVMAIHDEIMPKMGDIMKLKKQLQEKIDKLSDVEEVDSVKITNLEQAIADLDNSHKEMMGWMRQFNNDFEGMVNEEIMKYLNNQLGKIEKVGQATNAALNNAEEKLSE